MRYRVIQSHRVDHPEGGFEERLVGQIVESKDPLPENLFEPVQPEGKAKPKETAKTEE